MSQALPGEHLCKDHQGNTSHYAPENCTICRLQAEVNSLHALAAKFGMAMAADGTPLIIPCPDCKKLRADLAAERSACEELHKREVENGTDLYKAVRDEIRVEIGDRVRELEDETRALAEQRDAAIRERDEARAEVKHLEHLEVDVRVLAAEKADYRDLLAQARTAIADALSIIIRYGGIDGGHHKQWVLDQIVRKLTGENYQNWVAEYDDGDGDDHLWDVGIAP